MSTARATPAHGGEVRSAVPARSPGDRAPSRGSGDGEPMREHGRAVCGGGSRSAGGRWRGAGDVLEGLAAVRVQLRGALWPIPAIGILLAVGVGIALPALDEQLEEPGGGHPLTFVFGGGPAAARDVLTAIAGS